MKSIAILNILLVFFLIACQKKPQEADTQGNLLIIGGGMRPAAIMNHFVELAGGPEAAIAVIPTASAYYEESGARSVAEFTAAGARIVTVFNILDKETANSDSVIQKLSQFSGYYFGGGNQNRLTEIFTGTKSLDLFHKRYQEGAVVGGTSAGAAIMSDMMITGDGNWTKLMRDSVITTAGFGFLNNYIVDQHFIKRRRLNRLLALCLQYHTNGIGIDESTAIWVKPSREVEVIGERSVILIRGENACYPENPSGIFLTGKGLQLDVYASGDRFNL